MPIVCLSHPSTLHSRFKLMKVFSLQIKCYMISLILYFESCFVISSILHVEFQTFPAQNNPKPKNSLSIVKPYLNIPPLI